MSKHIIIVDDDEDDRLFFREAVKGSGVDAVFNEYANGESFLEYMQNSTAPKPDFIFLDINIPRIDGYDILNAIRAYDNYADTRVIMFTTSHDEDEIAKAMLGRASGFTTKPADYKVLEETIKNVVTHFTVRQTQQLFLTIVNPE
ncbi:response regulator [Flavobacterium sp. RHBU_24]|uniref:response regulator n=1 Tax=Flavobacterium sp. RHBU_24 TaxID=3391185 RepID=UPI0039846F19